MKKRIILTALAATTLATAPAQVNSPAPGGYLERAADMYATGNYTGCLDQLDRLRTFDLTPGQTMQLAYYRAGSTMHTDKAAAAGMLTRFLEDYPASEMANQATLNLAGCYYANDYARALCIYDRVDESTLSAADADNLRYHKAMCLLQTGDTGAALALFDKVAGSEEYGNAARFYRAYIEYDSGHYSLAARMFREVDTSTPPGDMAPYYLCQIHYLAADYTRALAMARELISDGSAAPRFIAEACRIAGESEYMLGNDSAAVPYLERYADATESPLPSALYILGLCRYNDDDYAGAIERLRPVTEIDDEMGQRACLYIGQAYLHLGDYNAAAMAFNRALNMHYDSSVRETAYYNYAVASLRGGQVPLASKAQIFTDFLKSYPRSKYAPKVQEYIVTSYISGNDYAAALASIEQMTDPSAAILAAKQQVLYALGNKLLATDPEKAAGYLLQARALARHSAAIDREVSLSLGEAYYLTGNHNGAVTELRKYLSGTKAGAANRPLARYDLGYALFALKDYGAALAQFEEAAASPGDLPANLVADAYNRIGDCRYFLKDFDKAATAYDTAYHTNPEAGDYALFQKALMYGFAHDYGKKVETLDLMRLHFPASALVPDALLETTQAYIQRGENAKALAVYRKLVDEYPNTAQGRQGYLQMALVLLNTGDREGARRAYRHVISAYPTSEEARLAVDQMKRVSAEDGTLREFRDFLQATASAPQIDESEVEQLAFENAEREYLTAKKTTALEDFAEEYPDSKYRPRALAYIAEGCYDSGDTEAAYDYAKALVEQYPASSQALTALAVKARVEESQGKGNLALRTWQQLAGKASSPSTLLEARLGIIRNGLESDFTDEVLAAARAVTSTSGAGPGDLDMANYATGVMLLRKGDPTGAVKALQKAAAHTGSLHGIRAALTLGEHYLDKKDLANAGKWARAAAEADSPYPYWIARGFILLSDVYTASGDSYKARQYLQAVKDNYSGSGDDIFEMIDQRLR